MAKAKSKAKPKEKKYVSPWAATKDSQLAHYVESYHRPGWQGPLDFSKLAQHGASKPGQGRGWMNKGEILNQKKEVKNG